MTVEQKHEEWKASQPYPTDKFMLERVKMDVREWLSTYGQIMMGDELGDDLCKVIESSYRQSLITRRKWEEDSMGGKGL